ncbi:MAG: hypothetical protein R3D60_08905 [Paracoccaceae bacterium]
MTTLINGSLEVRDSSGTQQRFLIDGDGATMTISPGPQTARVVLMDRAGDTRLVLDGENASIEGNKGGNITLRDGTRTRLSFDGSNGFLHLGGATDSVLNLVRDGDNMHIGLGTGGGFRITQPDGITPRVVIQPFGQVEIYDTNGALTFKINPETGDVSLRGRLVQL